MDKNYKQILERSTENKKGCIEWNGALNDAGYGVKKIEGKFWYVHRWSYAVNNGEIPDKMTVDHMCYNSKCHNPEHLRLLTHSQNCRDGVMKQLRDRLYSFPKVTCDNCGIEFRTTEARLRNKEKMGYKTMSCSRKCAGKFNGKNFNGTFNSELGKTVMQHTLTGEFIKEFPSNMQAQRETGVYNSGISSCCKGKRKTAGGFKWKYK